MISTEQITATAKSNFETSVALSTKTFGAIEKLVELNLQAVKVSIAEASEAATAAMSIRSVDQLVALQSSIVQPAGEKLASYSRHVYGILSDLNGEFTQVIEAAFSQAQRKIAEAVDTAAQKAPAGSSGVLTFAKSSIAAATSAYESVNKAAKQVSSIAEANILSVTSDAAKAVRTNRIVAAA